MKTALPTSCPTPQRLEQLVSGSLVESEAESLFRHLDTCVSCQELVDRLLSSDDRLLAAVRRADAESPSEEPGLARLISQAQQLPAVTVDSSTTIGSPTGATAPASSLDDTKISHRPKATIVSTDDFVSGLRRSGLIPGEELDQLLLDFGRQSRLDGDDSSSLARALIDQRKLTPFQAKSLLKGRWKGLVLGNYAILERLGQGGMGSVFKAKHTRMGRVVCLKVVNSAGRQSQAVIDRFRNEAHTLAALSHPNIVVAHDANESKGVPYLVMEYIDGADLAKTVRSDGPLGMAETLEIGLQTAEALDYAHGQGVIHRDVKPHNVVATREAGSLSVKVLDLGLARFDTLVTDNPDASVLAAMTNTGVVLGTVDYMSPEQAMDSRRVDARSDIYSLGCTLHFLLTGRPPFTGDTVMQRLVAHREQPLPRLPGGVASLEFEAVLHKMLAKRPEDRYQSMAEVLDEFHSIATGDTPSVTPLGPRFTAPPSPTAAEISDAATLISDPAEPLTASPLNGEADFEFNDAPPASPRRRRRRAKWIAGNGATAIALLVIAAAAVGAGPLWRSMRPRVGADLAIRNGGDGRALVVVGSDGFREDQYRSLTDTLRSADVDIVTASANYGTGKSDYGGSLKSAYDNINLRSAVATDYDAIFLVGGDCTKMTAKESEVHKNIVRLAESALQNDVVLTGCCEGWFVLQQTSLPYQPQFQGKPIFEAHDAAELAGKADHIFKTLTGKQAGPLGSPESTTPVTKWQ